MEGEPDLPNPPADSKFLKPNLSRPISIYPDSINLSRSFYANSTGSSTTSSSSSSPPEFVRHVQASFKRHCPTGMMQSNIMKPKRFVVPERGTSKDSSVKPDSEFEVKKNKEMRGSVPQSKNRVSVAGENQEDASIAAPSEWASTVNTHEKYFKTCNSQRDQHGLSTRIGSNKVVASSCLEPGNVLAEVQKKVHFSTEINGPSCGASQRMATGMDDLLSHMDSLAVTEMELDAGNRVDISAAVNQNWQHHNFQSMAGRTNQDFGNFLRNDSNIAMTQSSVVGSSFVTSTLINSTSAPMVSSTTYSLQLQNIGAHVGKDPEIVADVQMDVVQPSCSLPKDGGEGLPNHSNAILQAISSVTAMPVEVGKSSGMSTEAQRNLQQVCGIFKDFRENSNLTKGNAADVKHSSSLANVPLSEPKLENTKSEKLERGASAKPSSTSRKKGYDPDSFFKVNGKFYQRLGKIGSGGSSEVHKVISSDCTIYALKKIRLKGRDYATAYGFCQEIEYLNKLKGKNNIIQLIDYEVTDKVLLQQVMNGCMTNKDARVKDDGHIYMVLEYGEIDLAHMLAQKWKEKWKELDSSNANATINENWLRFYWQQILLAVNTIHEERIVHSDLKPANFLLVRGSLKLIDFGIAKAILSDTTNIQRDSQVGTLSYMSPEAFLCNDTDANGNTIKCGRPSDIWSLGCILYQMVYGRTPFSEYKTFWAKYKVITDPNHEIIYEPVSNPWLLDLMKKCLAWDRNERWRIPELLQHQFIVPPVPVQSLCGPDQFGKLFQQTRDMLLSQLQNMSRDQTHNLLCEFSTICSQLQEQLQKSKETERSD